MTNNADKEKVDPIKAAASQPKQDQQLLDTKQSNEISKATIENAEMFSDVNEEILTDDSTDKSRGQKNVGADLKSEKTSVPFGHGVQDRKDPVSDAEQSLKPMSRLNIFTLAFWSMLAGSVGFTAAYLVFFLGIFSDGNSPEEVRVSLSKIISSNSQEVQNLEETLQRQRSDIEQVIKTSQSLSEGISENRQILDKQMPFGIVLQTLKDQLRVVEVNVDKMTKRILILEGKLSDKAVSESVMDTYNNEAVALKSSIQAQIAQVDKLLAEASSKEKKAVEISNTTKVRIALAEVKTALEKGMPFVSELNAFATLTGQDVPLKLSELANSGAVTIAELSAQFPSFARRALIAHRGSLSENGLSSGFVNFLKSQFQARSVSPKDGNDADAILSRAEDALRQGNLANALEELSELTAPAKEEMVEWSNQAMERLAAMDSVKLLLASIRD